jgi:hypothetical protein
VTTAQIDALKEVGLVDAVVEEHLVLTFGARRSKWRFLFKPAILRPKEPLSSLVANRRLRLDDPQITLHEIEH